MKFNSLLPKNHRLFTKFWNKFYLHTNNQQLTTKLNFFIPFLVSKLGKSIPADAEPMVNFAFNIFILSAIVLFAFLNVVGYLIALQLITKYNIESKFSKYPRIKKFIRYYENSTLILVIIEAIVCIIALVFMIMISLMVSGIYLF